MFRLSLALITAFIFQTPTKNLEVKVTVAKTARAKAKGLQGVTYLNEQDGMLFKFDKPGYYTFWMDKTSIPLALLFLNKDFKIVDIKYGIPHSKKEICGKKPYQYVLEVNPQFVHRYRIRVGQKLIPIEK